MKLFIDQAMWFLGDLNNIVNEIDEIKKVSVLKTDSEKEIKTVYKQFDVIVEWLNKQSKKVWEKIEKLETMLIGIINESVKRTKKEQENLKEELKADITAFWPLLSEVKEMIWLVDRDHKREYEELEWKVSNKLEKTDLDEINKKLKKKYIDDENISEKTAYSSKKTIEKIDSMINNLRLWGRGKLFILNEWSDLWQATAINFTGSAVDVTVVNGVHTVDVTWGWWGSWDVVWPASAVDDNIATFNTTTGKLIQDWGAKISDLVPYTWATGDVNLWANGIILDSLKWASSWGLALKSSWDNDCLVVGNGWSANATAYWGWNFDWATADTIASFGATKTLTSLDTSTYPSLTELSYVKGVTSWIQAQLNAFANGMVYKWNRDASVWTFPWAWVTQTWWFYTVSVGWTVDSVVFNVWDRLIATTDNASTTVYASNWTQLDATDAVTSVNSQTWNVVLTTAEVADSSNKRYVTDANLTVIGNTSWTNTGDQTSIVWITGTLAEFNTALTGADFATLAWSEALTNKSVNWVTLVNWWTTTKYLSEDGTYTTPAWWSWGWFWTAVPWSPTRTGNTTFTLTDTSNANLYDLLLCRWTVLKRTESSTLRQAMVVSATYSTNVVTVTIIWDTMTSIDASSLKYGLEKARTRRFAIAGTIGATGTNVANTVMVETPAKVYWCDFWAGTAGSGTTTLDINKWWTTMFTTKPSILTTGQNILWVTADTATTATTGDYITIDIDATAGTTKIIDAYVNLYRYPLYSYYLS